jgi:hypothetical protein
VAAAHAQPPAGRRDLTLVLSAVGAIFAGLVGTNVLDTGSTAHNLVWIDHLAVVLWLPALFLLALCAYKSPDESEWMREGAWAATVLAGLLTAVVLLFTGFGFTRDKDHVRLLLSASGVQNLQALCGSVVHPDGSGRGTIDGTIRTATLQEEYVILERKKPKSKQTAVCDSVEIPRSDVVAIDEHP